MPIYEPEHVEHAITNGMIQIITDDSQQFPAYWAHPKIGRHFPGAVIIHDWWGMNDMVRRVSNLFAQMGYYVIAPDLFNGATTSEPTEAMKLVEKLGSKGYPVIHSALSVLETHSQCNGNVAAVGIGMGGSLAYEAAIVREDLEVSIAYGGFLHRYLGRFKDCITPICAFYGVDEPHIPKIEIQKLRKELKHSKLKLPHEVHMIEGLAHDIFSTTLTDAQREKSREVLKYTFEFLDTHLQDPPEKPK